MNTRRIHLAVAAAACPLLAGCAARLPTYGPMPADQALAIVAARAESVRTLSGTCRVRLTAPDGESVTFDGAIAAQPPDHFRLRTWKLGHAVLDLTVLDEQVWIAAPEPSGSLDDPAAGLADLPAGQISRAWSLVTREFYRGTAYERPGPPGALVVARPLDDGSEAICQIDRRTLTPRRFVIAAASDRPEQVVTLERWRTIDGAEWPTRLSFRGGAGRIDVMLDDIEINTELPQAAFIPPRRAVLHP